jgi:hypothetical protein
MVPKRLGSVCRLAATLAIVSVLLLRRVLGVGGSTSRMMRWSSPNAAERSSLPVKGVVPVSNS